MPAETGRLPGSILPQEVQESVGGQGGAALVVVVHVDVGIHLSGSL